VVMLKPGVWASRPGTLIGTLLRLTDATPVCACGLKRRPWHRDG
jgi:hypothetical protein